MIRLFLNSLLILACLAGYSQINMVVKQGGFLFLEGKDSIFFYQKSMKEKDGAYGRCNYIHPLYAADGTRLTEDFPADHLHHRGIFWAWHQILIDGKLVSDGWELKNFQQKVTNFEFVLQKGCGHINTTVDWKSPLWKNGAEPYLMEESTIVVYPKYGNYRRFDFKISLMPLVDGFRLGGSDDEKGYSGFSVRLKLPDDVSFSDGNGTVEPTTNAVIAGNVMKISGSFIGQNKKGGVVIQSNPDNPEPSNSWIIRKKASMQNVAYPGRIPVPIPIKQPLVLKYTLLVFQGEMNDRQIKNALKTIKN